MCFYLLYFCILLQLSKIVTIVLTATISNAELLLSVEYLCFCYFKNKHFLAFQHLVCIKHYILTCRYYKTSLLFFFFLAFESSSGSMSLQLPVLLSYWKQWMLLCALNLIQSIMFIGLPVRASSGRPFIADHTESPVCHLPHNNTMLLQPETDHLLFFFFFFVPSGFWFWWNPIKGHFGNNYPTE